MINSRARWTTIDELKFLGLAFDRKQDPSVIIGYLKTNNRSDNLEKRRLTLLKRYRDHMKDRKNWGPINPDQIRKVLNEEIKRLEEVL
jgi:hypothetical protein